MPAPNLTLHTRESAEDLLETVTDIHTEIYREPAFGGHPFFSESSFQQRYAKAVQQPGFELLTASIERTIIGCLYGYALRAVEGWWDAVEWPEQAQSDQQERDYTFENGKRTGVIPEILVRMQWRRQGVARLMHDEFLSNRPEMRGGLRVLPNNSPAKSAYLRWGWNTVGTVRPAPEGTAIRLHGERVALI